MEDVTLAVNGVEYGGWTEVEIVRSIEQIAGTFSLKVSERFPESPVSRPIRPGDECTLLIGGEVVITGHVDDVDISHDAASHEVTVRGRDATGDLVDSAAVHEPGEWSERRLDRIAADLAKPFGISVRAAADVGKPFPKFRLEEGETAFEAIERMCRQRAILPVSDGKGGLVLTRRGTARAPAALVLGLNIKAASGSFSDRERFQRYIVKAQQSGNDFLSGEAAASPKAEASDPAIARYRPAIVLAEEQGDGATLAERAKWEASVRAGRARRGEITVQGFRAGGAGGRLWNPNQIVSVEDEFLGINADMLIATVAFRLTGADGRVSVLSVARPEAFDLIELPAPKEKDELWFG